MVGLWEDLDLGPRAASILLLTLGITLTYLGRWGFTAASELVILGGSVLLGGAWLLAVLFRFWVDHPRQRRRSARPGKCDWRASPAPPMSGCGWW